jgi:hypothetical protein
MKIVIAAAVIGILALSATSAMAKKGSARAACLAEAGTTEAIFSARRATYAQGAVYKSCMLKHGQNVTVRRGDGSVLY